MKKLHFKNLSEAKSLLKSSLRKKAGVYQLINRINKKSYIGSSVDNTPLNIIPVETYHNAELCKSNILNDNKNKTGIYRWVNKLNGHSYIGSGINLKRRLSDYYSSGYISNALLKGKSIIYKAILKHGYSNFQLEILEYCSPEDAIHREQYYIILLKPEYNLNPQYPN